MTVPKTFEDWYRAEHGEPSSLSDQYELRTAFEGGAAAMLEALIERGYIGADYAEIARKGVNDLTGQTP